MLKRIVRIKDDVFYNPSHNTFFRLDNPKQLLLTISGSEEKIFEYLLCRPNQPVTRETIENEFWECADPYNKTIDRLRRDKIEGVLHLDGVLVKNSGTVSLYLQECPFESSRDNKEEVLLHREVYFADYDMILSEFSENKNNIHSTSILVEWIQKCQSLKCYDEQCIFFLERLAFLPAIGSIADKYDFIDKAQKTVYRFTESDIHRYGDNKLLLLVRNLIFCVTDYLKIQIKHENSNASYDDYQRLLQKFQTISISKNMAINPLILLAYYDYQGLVYYNIYKESQNHEYLLMARFSFETAITYTSKVDMHLQVWEMFITFNLARVYEELGEIEKAFKNYAITVTLRQCLAESPFFSNTIKQNLLYEYYLAQISYIDASFRNECFSEDDAQTKYRLVFEELETHYSKNNKNGHYQTILQMLQEKMQK